MMVATESVPATPTRRQRGYWRAEGLIVETMSMFHQATDDDDPKLQRRLYYKLASYYGRTVHILNSALSGPSEQLAQAALHNLMALHRAMIQMHRTVPEVVPLSGPYGEDDRHQFVRDVIIRVLSESPVPLGVRTIRDHVNHLDMLGQITLKRVRDDLSDLEETDHVTSEGGKYGRTLRPYVELDLDVAGLRGMLGPEVYYEMAERGFLGLRDVDSQPGAFVSALNETAGVEERETSQLFVEVCRTVLGTTIDETVAWQYADLVNGPFPRPYQREAFVQFRHGNYQNLIIEAPTGSGKTLIGQMCIQDWMRAMHPGQSILILVPTTNYQQQWVGEMCYNDIGLQLSPEITFSGTPHQFDQFVAHTGEHPAILLVTYTALAQLGSPTGKGGFDAQSVERFLQQANVQYVVLDEVHKVVENMHSVTTDVTRLLSDWRQDGSLRALIGFSGTAESYRSRFEQLGLQLVHSVPMDDLVAAGFVAPFAELGVPFSHSVRERRVRDLLEDYKDGLRDYFSLLGPQRLREWFGQLPLEERLEIGHELLGMYHGHRDWQESLEHRFDVWEKGKPDGLSLNEIRLVTILQIAGNWSDQELVRQAGADQEQFDTLVDRLSTIRWELQDLIYLPATQARLQADRFAHTFDTPALRKAAAAAKAADRVQTVKDELATSITGLYDGLSEWYRRVGEGRVATIKAIIEAERAVRYVSGIIIFDTGRHLDWREEIAKPGYVGLAGLFAEMLGDPRFTCLAALSNEMYLSYDEADPLPPRIADYVEQALMRDEVADAMYNLAVQGLDLPEDVLAELRQFAAKRLNGYLPRVRQAHAARHGEFNRRVLRPLRRKVRNLDLGLPGERLLARLDARNVHLHGLVQTFYDYALIARRFREAPVGQLEQVSGARQKFFVVSMPSGSQRKQLMYDLTSRIVDEPSLPVNLVIVSNWARTGWNVIQPNVLIDATATRDLTAWMQLRGRAIRALRSWTNDSYRLLVVLDGHDRLRSDGDEPDEAPQPADDARTKAQLYADLLGIFRSVASEEMVDRVQSQYDEGGRAVEALSAAERQALVLRLVQSRNKVTHIYEMVKAYGSGSQVTFNRAERNWVRRKAIAAKHWQEVAVNPFTGEKLAGPGHAPLMYAADPRSDLPSALQEHVAQAIPGSDEIIILGWMESE